MLIEFLIDDNDDTLIELPVNQRLLLVQGISLLEEQNRELIATNDQLALDYAIYNDKDQELPTLEATLKLPETGKTIIEAIQAPVKENEEIDSEDAQMFLTSFQKSLPRNIRPNTSKRIISKKSKMDKSPKKEADTPKTNATIKLSTLVVLVFGVLFLIAAFRIGQVVIANPTHSDEVTKKVNELEDQLQQQEKIETFSRFFLTNYYTKTSEKGEFQSKVKRFVDKGILDEFTGTNKQVKSIMPWEINRKATVWNVTFVVTLENGQGKIETQQVSFSIRKSNDKYLVSSVPKEELFEINQ